MNQFRWVMMLLPALLLTTQILTTQMAVGQNLDSVIGARGTPTYGEVTEISPTQITVTDTQGQKKLFPVNDIQKITFAGEPRELRKARESIRGGQFEAARSDLEQISTEGISRQAILQDIEFYKAFCDGRLALVGGGDKSAAVRALLAFLGEQKNKSSYHYFTAVELIGDLAVGLQRYANAIEYYRLLGEAPWPDYQLRASELEAQALLADGQHAEALQKFEAVLASGLDTAAARDLKQLATCGKAVCLAAAGQTDAGIQLIEQIIANHDSREKPILFARAYNALGNCYLKADQPQEALLAFLHVSLLFHQDPDAHAEALYYLTKLWRTVDKPERAIRTQGQLRSRYSGSRWADRK